MLTDLGKVTIESWWPTSVMGWLTLFGLTIAAGKSVFNYATGRALTMKGIANSLANADKQFIGINTRLDGLDANVDADHELLQELDWELRGPKGENGIKSKVALCLTSIERIEVHNRQRDLLAERFKQIFRNYSGPERRGEFQQLKDMIDELDQEERRR